MSRPLYTQAVANTRLVGLELSYLIKKLRDDHGLNTEDVHLIGKRFVNFKYAKYD